MAKRKDSQVRISKAESEQEKRARIKTFVTEVTRNGEVWVLQVPAVDFVTTRARNLFEAEEELRGMVAGRLGLKRNEVTFEMQNERAWRLRQGLSAEVQPHPAIIPSSIHGRS